MAPTLRWTCVALLVLSGVGQGPAYAADLELRCSGSYLPQLGQPEREAAFATIEIFASARTVTLQLRQPYLPAISGVYPLTDMDTTQIGFASKKPGKPDAFDLVGAISRTDGTATIMDANGSVLMLNCVRAEPRF
jgi:hypothetical protein